MSEYASMSDEELRRVIAERLGWKNIELRVNAPGRLLLGNSPNTGKCVSIPQWPTNVNMALRLLDGLPYRLNARWGGNLPYNVMINPRDAGWMHEHDAYAEADSPARAVCLAWLAWKDAQGQ